MSFPASNRVIVCLFLAAVFTDGPFTGRAGVREADAGAAATHPDTAGPMPTPFPASRAPATKPAPDVPDYARPFRTGALQLREVAMATDPALGVEVRQRFEYRSGAVAFNADDENGISSRARLYLQTGAISWLNGGGFRLELQDSRPIERGLAETAEFVNENEILQLMLEMPLGSASLRVGRQSFDLLDRRLFTRATYANTTAAFDGIRLRVGDETEVLEWNAIALSPVIRQVDQPDVIDDQALLMGLTWSWRAFSPNWTFEPYVFGLVENSREERPTDRDFLTFGAHIFGDVRNSRLDYDVNLAGQFGENAGRTHRAMAAHAELGWRPVALPSTRFALAFDYATGDGDPEDGRSRQFDPLFGDLTEFYGYARLVRWSNIVTPSMRLQSVLSEELAVRLNYRAYWLAERSARLSGTPPVAAEDGGFDGDFLGHALEFRLMWVPYRWMEWEAGAAWVFGGNVLDEALPDSPETVLAYIALTLSL